MKTASWSTYAGNGRVGICRGAPRGASAGYRFYRNLAPGAWFNSVSKAEYERLFAEEILGKRDAQQTWDSIHTLVHPFEPVLLCFEKPPFTETNWCHRRLVAAWFEENLGVIVPEMERAAGTAPARLEGI
ncbi:MAG: hypothetical protein ACOY2B_02210 [Pseudomonadota bacterium]